MAGIRRALQEDTPGIHALIREVYAEYGCVLDVDNDEPHLLEPDRYYRDSGGELWVVDAEGRIAAVCAVWLHDGIAELKTLYVQASHRRRGIARELVCLAMEHARCAGISQMVLWTDTRFTAAHALYRSLGFEQTGIRELNDINASVEYRFERSLTVTSETVERAPAS